MAVDGVICTLGTTMKKAGSQAAFRAVDHDLPLAVARLALLHGARSFALNSTIGADPGSRYFYTRTKGEIEEAVKALGFASLTIVRPGIIGDKREESRPAEQAALFLATLLAPILPSRLRINPAERIAQALIDGCAARQAGIRIVASDN